jgi:hypothetical protein
MVGDTTDEAEADATIGKKLQRLRRPFGKRS